MKINNMIKSCRLLLCLLPLLFNTNLNAQQDKTIDEHFSNIRHINIEHRNGSVVVKPSPDNKTYVRAVISVDAASPEDIQTIYDQFDLQMQDQGGKLYLKTVFNIVSSNNIAGSIRLTFKDGTKVRNIKKLQFSLEVQTPDLETLFITSKYNEVGVEGVNISELLTLEGYETDYRIGNISGELDLNAKYSKGAVGNVNHARLVLYECKLQFGDGKETELNTKYSKLVFGRLQSLSATSYEDEITIREIEGDISLDDKYSDFQLGAFRNGRMDLYETKLTATAAADIQLKSKYAKIKIDRVENIQFELSYEDKAEFGRIGSLSTVNSKYGEFNIGTLEYVLALNSYEDDVTIQQIQPTLKNIILEGKYVNLNANLPDQLPFQLEADMKYGKLEYPGGHDAFNWLIYKEKGDDLEIRGKSKGATDQSPMIRIATYEGKISLN